MRITIGKKLGIGFFAVIIVLLTGALFGIYQMRRSSDMLQNVSKRRLALAIEGMAVRACFDEMVWSTKNILLRGTDMNETRKNLLAIDEKKKQLDRWNLMVAELLSSEDFKISFSLMNHYSEYKKSYSEYTVAWDNALPLYSLGGCETADEIMKKIEDRVGSRIYLLAMEFRRIAYAELENALKISNLAVLITIITIIISVIAAVVVSMILSGRIKMAVIHLKKAADDISRGNLKNPLKPISEDELGDLAASFERMRISFIKITERLERNRK